MPAGRIGLSVHRPGVGPAAGASYDDIGEHWRVTELLAEQRREADWRSRATSAVCLGVLAGLLVAGYAIQAARLG